MKKFKVLFVFFFLFGIKSYSFSQQLEIHHINVNNGDATVIALKNQSGGYVFKMLIDGGEANAGDSLLPYINNVFRNTHFDYVVLTHYHRDHYRGLLALGNGSITADSLIDPGGYRIKNVYPACPDSVVRRIQSSDSLAGWGSGSVSNYVNAVRLAAQNHGLRRCRTMEVSPGNEKNMIGKSIRLGRLGGIDVRLRCVTYWGWVLYDTTAGIAKDIWEAGSGNNINNTCMSFVLEFGKFRYFLGGDIGGDDDARILDIETPLSAGFRKFYRGAKSFNSGDTTTYDGHICGFKASHHGSSHSNKNVILNTIRPAVCVTSAGDKRQWHLPSVNFILRLNQSSPVTRNYNPSSPFGYFQQGFFFTNLHDFYYRYRWYRSLSVADSVFTGRNRTKYDHGGCSYIIVVNPALCQSFGGSYFIVYKFFKRMGAYTITRLEECYCHK